MSDLSEQFADFAERSIAVDERMAENIELLMQDLNFRREQEEIQAAAAAAVESEQSKQSLVADVAASVMAALAASGIVAAAPRRGNTPPARRTQPISAAAVDLDEADTARPGTIELQLAGIQGQIAALEALPYGQADNVRIMDLLDQQATLVARLR